MDNIDYKAKVGFVPAGDGGRIAIVLSFASESPSLLGAEACGAKNALVKDVPAKSCAEASDESIIKKDLAAAEAPAAGAVDSDKAKATSLLGAKACGVKNVKDISVAKSGTDDVLKKDPAVEKVPDAGAVDSDKATAMFAAHAPRRTAVFWSKFTRPTSPPTARTGAVEGAFKTDIPAAESGAEASVDETGAIKNSALKPATKVATVLKPVAVCGETLPSIKEFPEAEPAPAGDADWTASAKKSPEEKRDGISEWTTPSKSRRNNERKEASAPIVLCTVFTCLIAASGGAFAYFSHGSDGLLPSIVVPDATALPTETERGPLFAPFNPAPDPVVPDPPDVVNDPAWLIATSGFCSNLNVVMNERDVEASETEGDMAGHFVADIEFNYYPQTAVKFTDFPYHMANAIEGDKDEADALVSPAWDHKNIALLEPTTTCGVDEQSNQAWGISVFKVEEHRACADGETAWEGHPCVHFTGYVSAETSNFVMANAGRFVCQLFVDSGKQECDDECQYSCHDIDSPGDCGRDCCTKHQITNEKCSLNGETDTCKCGATRSTCYIDMRCDRDQTWQNDECRTKPDHECSARSSCTNGYACSLSPDQKHYRCLPSEHGAIAEYIDAKLKQLVKMFAHKFLQPLVENTCDAIKNGIITQLKKVGKICLVNSNDKECSSILSNPIFKTELFSTSYMGEKILTVTAQVDLNACMEVKEMTIDCENLANFVEETATDWFKSEVTEPIDETIDEIVNSLGRRLAANGGSRTHSIIEEIAEAALKEVSGEGHRRLHEAHANPDRRGSIEMEAYHRGVEMIQQRLADAFVARYEERGRRASEVALTDDQKHKYKERKNDIDIGELKMEYTLQAKVEVTADAEMELDEQRSVDLLEKVLGKKAQFSQSGRFTPVPLLFAAGFSAGVEMGIPLEMKASFAGKARIVGTVGYDRTWTLTMSPKKDVHVDPTRTGEDDGVTITHTGEVAASLSVSIGAYVDVNLRADVYIATVVNLYAEASANWKASAGADLAACAHGNMKANTKRICESLTPQLAPPGKVEYDSALTRVPDGADGLYAQVGAWVYVPYPQVDAKAGITFPGSDQAAKCLGADLTVKWHGAWTGSIVSAQVSKTVNALSSDAKSEPLQIRK